MLNEKSKRRTDKDESSEVGQRCGRIRSSEEIAVMAMERRDSVIYVFDKLKVVQKFNYFN